MTGRPRSSAACFTGDGDGAPAAAPAPVGLGHDQRDLVAGLDQRAQRPDRHLGRAQEDEAARVAGRGRQAHGRVADGVSANDSPLPLGSASASTDGPMPSSRIVLSAALRGVGVEPLEQQHAVEVVELVLEAAGQELVGLDRHVVAVEVDAGQVHLLGPHDLPRQAGHRQAPLLVGPLAVALDDLAG